MSSLPRPLLVPALALLVAACIPGDATTEATQVNSLYVQFMVAAAAVFCPGVTMRVDVSATTDPAEPLADPELRPRYDQVLQRAAAAARRQGGGA